MRSFTPPGKPASAQHGTRRSGMTPPQHAGSVGPSPRMYIDLSFLLDRGPRETSVGGSAAGDGISVGGGASPAPVGARVSSTVALSDGTRITFSAPAAVEALEVS